MLNLKSVISKDNKVKTVSPFLCDKIKEFGFCEESCLERHTLCKTLDKECLNIPTKCFISIQMTKVISASHYYGRILKYSNKDDPVNDQDWICIDDSFEIIKDELKNIGLQDTKVVHKNPVVGELVMIENNNEFFRAVVLDILKGWLSTKVKVKLIDLGFIEEIDLNKVFLLSNHLKQFRPISVEIIVSSMEPVGEGECSVFNWPIETTNVVRSLLQPIILADLKFICKVEFTLGITLWADWLLARKCIKCSHFVCKLYTDSIIFPKELIERNVAKLSSQIINKIIDLSKDAHIWKEEPIIDVDEKKSIISVDKTLIINKKNELPLFACEERESKTDDVIKVQWAHLSKDTIFHVSICYIDNPKCFLVRNLKFNDCVKSLQNDIKEAVNNETTQKLTSVTVGTVCLAISPDQTQYNRVSIQQINGETAIVLYVDFGDICMVKIKNLLTIPSWLITKLPFQLIECNLSGFNNIVETDIIDQFIDRFIQLVNTGMYLKVLSSSADNKLTGGISYEVVLFNNDINVNITMADEFKMHVDSTQIQYILSSNYKYENINDGDENIKDESEYDEAEMDTQLELLESLIKNSEKSDENKIVSDSTNSNQEIIAKNSMEMNENQTVLDSLNLNQDITENNEQEKNINIMKYYCQECIITPIVPQCYWHQDDKWIYLKLNVLAVKNYDIIHTIKAITITVETNSVSYNFTAVLYASIKKELFTCRIGFDGIYIKAQKLIILEDNWPRLLSCPNKHKYIIYDTEYIDHKDSMWASVLNKYKQMAFGVPLKITNGNNSSTEDSDSDDENYTIFED